MAAATAEEPSGAEPPPQPDFRSPAWLRAHARDACLAFWVLRAPRPAGAGGGLFHCLRDDGSVYDARTRHLVSSTRLVVQFAWAAARGLAPLAGGAPGWTELLASCLRFLRERHLGAASPGGHAWTLRCASGGGAGAVAVEDGTNYAYGMAFCLLAYASARPPTRAPTCQLGARVGNRVGA